MRFFKAFSVIVALLFILPVQAKRVALVMGNDNYTVVSKLQKAGNDATAMARELKAAQEKVKELEGRLQADTAVIQN